MAEEPNGVFVWGLFGPGSEMGREAGRDGKEKKEGRHRRKKEKEREEEMRE